MKTITEWGKRLEQLCSEYEQTVKTQESAQGDLKVLVSEPGSPIKAVTIAFVPRAPFDEMMIGEVGQGPPTDVSTLELDGTACRISWWSDSAVAADKVSLHDLLTRFVRAWWKPQLRDHKSRLFSLDYPEANELLDAALASFPDRAFVLFADLDHFKNVNDKYGQDAGDEAILQFSAMVDGAVRPNGIPIHRSSGGDEFGAVLLSHSADTALSIAARLMQKVKSSTFSIKGDEVSLSVSIGVALSPSIGDAYADIERLAVKACKPAEGEKLRGRISFSATSGHMATKAISDFLLSLACCLVRSTVADETPFSNVLLNSISQSVVESLRKGEAFDRLQSVIDLALQSSTALLVPGVIQAAAVREEGSNVSPEISPIDVCLAAAHGLLRAVLMRYIALTGSLELSFDPLFQSCDLRLNEDACLHVSVASPVNQMSYPLGGFITSSAPFSKGAARRALLIRIGHSLTSLPNSLFAETIVVDDRPTTGGGLPDFWEATIARIVGQLDRNPNIVQGYVLGDQSSAAFTVQRLRGIEHWARDAEQMAFKTGMPADKIRMAATRLSGRITFCSTPEEIVTHLEPILREASTIQPVVERRLKTGDPFLKRDLEVSSIALTISDGCRVDTISQAYPVVVEIVRKTGQCWLTKDQAGIELRELTDFKVQLARPLEKQIPAFYEGEAQSLQDYFGREFISEKGTFGRVFAKTRQIEPVIRHVCDVVRQTDATTRRGIIIIPHDPGDGADLSPLGLVCVRIVPRISEKKVGFDFSFVWRTVEVLVGFPYSLYGSVKFSEHLTSLLRASLPPPDHQVELGEVSYIAQSLHMFSDEYGKIIARRIVNDASL
jgi:diguanylate cyclase (GGDEF)-like protein